MVVVRVVGHVPAVAVMTNLAGCIVLEDDPPGLTDSIVAESPRAWGIRLDLLKGVDGTVVPLDAPGDVLAVGTALDQGRD